MRGNLVFAAFLGWALLCCSSPAAEPARSQGPVQSSAPAAGVSPPSSRLAVPSPPTSPASQVTQTPDVPQFRGAQSPVDAGRLASSWRPGCPVPVEDLRLLTLNHWGFDGKVHTGELVVHRDQADKVLGAMERLFALKFPIEKMELVDVYGADDDLSTAANNTSAFNCREVENSPGVWSQHSYGRAIDINPVQNPYLPRSGPIDPPAGAAYSNRSDPRPGMVLAGGGVVRAFSAIGWQWGGYWKSSKDYQHFSSNGR